MKSRAVPDDHPSKHCTSPFLNANVPLHASQFTPHNGTHGPGYDSTSFSCFIEVILTTEHSCFLFSKCQPLSQFSATALPTAPGVLATASATSLCQGEPQGRKPVSEWYSENSQFDFADSEGASSTESLLYAVIRLNCRGAQNP